MRFLGRKKPLQTVLFITDACNLSCRHCAIYNHEHPVMKPVEQIREELLYSYRLGSRFVDFEGGEPTLWRQGEMDVNSLIAMAKEIGFYSCTITTNAQRPFGDTAADSVWVSMDGVGPVHDDIRGEGAFARMEANVAACGHSAVSVNMTINRRNLQNVEEAVRYVEGNPHIKQISFSFHTPYAGTEHLFVDWETRAKVVDRLIELKKKRAPIMNSVSGLKLLKTNQFKKECWVSNFILHDGTRFAECTGKAAGYATNAALAWQGRCGRCSTFVPTRCSPDCAFECSSPLVGVIPLRRFLFAMRHKICCDASQFVLRRVAASRSRFVLFLSSLALRRCDV